MQWIVFVIILAISCAGPSDADAMSVTKFQELDAAAADKPEAAAQLDMYLRGIYEGVLAINADLDKRERRPIFCMQKSVSLAPINVREMIKKRTARLRKSMSSSDYDATLNADLALFVLDGMRDGFPCS